MMISIKNLTKQFNSNIVLNNINIDLDKSVNLLIGDNGSGKSTLINILAGVVKPNFGSVIINDKMICFNDGTYKEDIGFLLNAPTFPHFLKLKEYISFLNFIYEIDLNFDKTYQDNLLIFFELNKFLDYQLSELSTGYLKRVKLLASMLHKPSLFIFDEPFSGLDINFIPLLVEKIIDLSNQGCGFLISSHLSQITTLKFADIEKFKISNGKINKIH